MRKKHAEQIIAWAQGAEIERFICYVEYGEIFDEWWEIGENPTWSDTERYKCGLEF